MTIFVLNYRKKNKSCGENAFFLTALDEKLIILKNIINNIMC